jgi:hypothetical protein
MKKLVYLDSDIYVAMNMGDLNRLLGKFSIILTPHITKQLPMDGCLPDELTFLKAGTFNAGFIAMSNSGDALDFISWWGKRLRHFALYNEAEGMSADQRWIDLAPSLFDEIHILKNPAYNVAYWNLHERKLSLRNGTVMVNGEPLRFFHFSRFDPGNIESIIQYQNRFRMDNLPTVRYLSELYKNCLISHGYEEIRSWPYSYDSFCDGTAIPHHARRIYWELGKEAKRFSNPFMTAGRDTFYEYYFRTFNEPDKPIDRKISWREILEKKIGKLVHPITSAFFRVSKKDGPPASE